ncbi:MAG: M20 family metallopeptidase [Eubacteriales bacterium]|nr:M20 family metallopeptidase [Eubacteriales bacterium]
MRTPGAAGQTERMRRDRRALHRIPEIGRELPKTLAYVREALRETAPDSLTDCAGGLKAVYRAGDPLPGAGAVAFRADMDALPVEEKTGLPFASEHRGAMHACGHDGHMAVLLGLARLLGPMRPQLRRDVTLIFQPAEENIGGARRMIDAGLLEEPHVDEVYGLHLWPGIPQGKYGVAQGSVMSGVGTVDVTVEGVSVHGAAPHTGADCIAAAAQAVLSLQGALMRTVDAAQPVVFTVGKISGGTMRNILAAQVKLECTARAFSDENMETVLRTAREAFEGADRLYGTRSQMDVITRFPPVVNDARAVARVRAAAGEDAVDFAPVSVGEDFSEYQKERPGAFVFCGVGDTHPLHSDRFDFDEESLVYGLSLFEKILQEANENVWTL